jgi:hypothetical protein
MNANNVIGSHISSAKFSWIPKSNEFVAEISDLHGTDPLGQLYADACDQGFVMISEKTGKKVEFTLADIRRDADSDIMYWEFVPTSTAIFYNRNLQDVKVILLND